MNSIELQQTLPAVFAGRDFIVSDVWHQSLQLKRGEAYLIEAASGTGKSSLCSYIYGYRNDYQGIVSFDGKNIRNFSVTDWVEITSIRLACCFRNYVFSLNSQLGRIFNSRILSQDINQSKKLRLGLRCLA